eukprot:s158_g34.t1
MYPTPKSFLPSFLPSCLALAIAASSSSVASAAADAARKSSAEARAAAERAAALAAAVGERRGTSDPTSDAIDSASDGDSGRGDWAAWSAGADIDRSHSSGGLGRSLLGRLGRVLATLVPVTRTFLGAASHSPEVVLTWETGAPSRCFAMDLPRGSLAIRFSRDIRPSHVVSPQML